MILIDPFIYMLSLTGGIIFVLLNTIYLLIVSHFKNIFSLHKFKSYPYVLVAITVINLSVIFDYALFTSLSSFVTILFLTQIIHCLGCLKHLKMENK